MRNGALPPAKMTLDPAHAQRFLLSHQRLLPPRRLEGEQGILDFLAHIGCVQFDPIDIVGRNPDLVLQSRIAGYRPAWLDGLMHSEHRILVGWDKMAALILRDAWPHFARHRALNAKRHGDPETPAMKVAPYVLDEIRRRGPLCSRDIEHDAKVDWWWGRETRLVRASLEVLSAMGVVLTHHRVRSVRYFDLTERILPPEILNASDPLPKDEAYQDWHVLRRVGSLGLAPATGAPEYWYGIMGVNGVAARSKVLARLADRQELVPVAVDRVDNRLFLIRAVDLSTLESAGEPSSEPAEAAFIAPLDNVIWDREQLKQLFDFHYRWEVYTPKAKRTHGYYVLPVLYGDRFIARVEPVFDKKARVLTMAGWWWERGVRPNAAMRAALSRCVTEFGRYLGAKRVVWGDAVSSDKRLAGILSPGRAASQTTIP